MTDSTHTVHAPQGALAWTAMGGWRYAGDRAPSTTETGDLVLVVSDDGYLRGVTLHDRAPLIALLRIDGQLTEIVARIDQLADRVAGLDTGLAVDVSMLKGRVRQLENRGSV